MTATSSSAVPVDGGLFGHDKAAHHTHRDVRLGYRASASRAAHLISDIGMPEADGYVLIKQLRALAPQDGGRTPAVALTAFARTEERTKALVSGFNMHVPKPVEPAELVAVLCSLAAGFKKT